MARMLGASGRDDLDEALAKGVLKPAKEPAKKKA
jgi:hypothetical protein